MPYLSNVPSKSGSSSSKSSSSSSKSSRTSNFTDTSNAGGNEINLSSSSEIQIDESNKSEAELNDIISKAQKLLGTAMGQQLAVAYISKQNLNDEDYNKVKLSLGL